MKQKYIIPFNFAVEGVAFGNVKWRNLIETSVIIAALALIIILIPLSVSAKIYICIITMLPLGIFGIKGINGLSFTSFLADFMGTQRNKKIFKEPNSAEKVRREQVLIRKMHKKMKQQKKEDRKLAKYEKKQVKLDKREQKPKKKRGEAE